MRYLLDTNACIGYLNGHAPQLRRRLQSVPPDQIAVCSIVKAELYYGSMKSDRPERSLAGQREFLDRFASLPFDDQAAEVCGRIRADLERRGTPIGPNDLLIASIAVANDLILVTANVREFERVDGLRFEDWETA